MKLYHYSNAEAILEEGLRCWYKHTDTDVINDLIYEVCDDYLYRNSCIFFNFDKRDDGDIVVSVNINDLNKDLLYVADQDLADRIYSLYYKGKDCIELVKQYVDSIVKLEDYDNSYENSEVFYIDDVPIELLNIETIYE